MANNIDYMEVMGTLGSIAAKHPQTTSLLMQTFSLWNSHANEARKVQGEYQEAAQKATGPLDQAGIAMQLVALYPIASQLLLQTLAMWQSRIPDLIQVINEFQASSDAAAKT
jgi:hypothetical protein